MAMKLIDDLVSEAAGWLNDIGYETPSDASQAEVVETVNRLYDGGWRAFVAADGSQHEPTVWLFMVRRFGMEFANLMLPYPS